MRNRNHRFLVSFTEDEKNILMTKVKKSGLSRERYMRMSSLGYPIHENPPIDFYALTKEMNRIGNNLNQLLVNAYSKGFVDVPLLRKHLKELNDIENRLWAELKPGDK